MLDTVCWSDDGRLFHAAVVVRISIACVVVHSGDCCWTEVVIVMWVTLTVCVTTSVISVQNLCNNNLLRSQVTKVCYFGLCLSYACLCDWLAQCVLSRKRLSAGPGFNPQTRQNKLFQNYWRACFEINFSDRQEGLTVSSIICDRYVVMVWLWWLSALD